MGERRARIRSILSARIPERVLRLLVALFAVGIAFLISWLFVGIRPLGDLLLSLAISGSAGVVFYLAGLKFARVVGDVLEFLGYLLSLLLPFI